jgi:hypothetical protein
MILSFICLDANSWGEHSALEQSHSGPYICFFRILHPVRFLMPREAGEFTASLCHAIVSCALNSGSLLTQGSG